MNLFALRSPRFIYNLWISIDFQVDHLLDQIHHNTLHHQHLLDHQLLVQRHLKMWVEQDFHHRIQVSLHNKIGRKSFQRIEYRIQSSVEWKKTAKKIENNANWLLLCCHYNPIQLDLKRKMIICTNVILFDICRLSINIFQTR